MSGDKKSKGLEASMQKLESIVADLEKGESSLEEALDKFEEGLGLGKKCKELLDRAELRVKKLVEDTDGELKEEELGGDA
ncbi:MAG: exodeoxyribonuclease VII small subunit [Candidatus Krumholzibacteria bacterium]|jgi:exodeoxyribonuclease VII small subunit|nr:exodeoxyribonuclease VII small subunit [Candidatus Krumholzibacteria bacterium]